MRNRVLVVILVMVLALSSVGVVADTNYGENYVTRAEFARIVAGMVHLADIAVQSETEFYDVSADHHASGYILIMQMLGVVQGNGAGYFRPDDLITTEQAATMLVRALGYAPMANARGGYPTGYLVTANTAGFRGELHYMEQFSFPTGYATRELLAVWVNNALDIPLMQRVIWEQEVFDPNYADFVMADMENFAIMDGLYGNSLITLSMRDWGGANVYFDGESFVVID